MWNIIYIYDLTNKYKLRLYEDTGGSHKLLCIPEESTSSNHTGNIGRQQENKARW